MYWSFSLSISPSSEHSGLISFRIVWFDLLSVQEAAESATLGETDTEIPKLHLPPKRQEWQKIALTRMPGSQESQTPEMGLNSPQSHGIFICHLLVTSTPCVCVSHSVVPNSLQLHDLKPTRLLCPWNSPGKNTGVGCHFLSSQPRDQTRVSCIAGRFFTV